MTFRSFYVLGFSIEGTSQAKIECDDNGDGSANIRYYPTAPGEYAVHILCDNEDIPNSPYIAQILPSTDYYPDKVFFAINTLTVLIGGRVNVFFRL